MQNLIYYYYYSITILDSRLIITCKLSIKKEKKGCKVNFEKIKKYSLARRTLLQIRSDRIRTEIPKGITNHTFQSKATHCFRSERKRTSDRFRKRYLIN